MGAMMLPYKPLSPKRRGEAGGTFLLYCTEGSIPFSTWNVNRNLREPGEKEITRNPGKKDGGIRADSRDFYRHCLISSKGWEEGSQGSGLSPGGAAGPGGRRSWR